MTLQIKRLVIILAITTSILLIPFIAMQFTSEVNWKISDFIVAGVLIFGTGILFDFVLRKTKNLNNRVLYLVAIIVVFLLIWAELAVGIFGSPFAGS